MLNVEDTALLVIDIQGKLAQMAHEKETLFDNVKRMIKAAGVLDIPVILTEQNPAGLGPTVPEIAELIDAKPISKFSFSCCSDESFMQALKALGREQILLAGIETHVCVYQTAADLVRLGYEAHVLVDAVSSRKREYKEIGIQKIRDCGGVVTCVETALFELLKIAEGDKFRQIIKIVK